MYQQLDWWNITRLVRYKIGGPVVVVSSIRASSVRHSLGLFGSGEYGHGDAGSYTFLSSYLGLLDALGASGRARWPLPIRLGPFRPKRVRALLATRRSTVWFWLSLAFIAGGSIFGHDGVWSLIKGR